MDGLRGIAILLVVFYHNFGFVKYFFFGWLGVDLFFVLSGFLITDILLKTVNKRDYFKNFYAKRVLRIFPLYYLSLIIFLVILPQVKDLPIDLSFYVDHQWWFWTYLQNWFLIFYDVGNTTTAIQHYWSLAVEEQFYIVWPLVIFIVRKPKLLLTIAGFLLLAVICVRLYMWTIQIKDLNYFGLYTYTRIDGICIGSILAILQCMRSTFINKYFTGVVLL
ncbi:MAG TPA: acyltransferase, partial [Chitinophagaceae bacterium]|nr:acyltransferase [Chitinophagaceae bacterium]